MDEIYNRTNSLSLELDEIIDRRNFLLIQYYAFLVRFLCVLSSTCTRTRISKSIEAPYNYTLGISINDVHVLRIDGTCT